MSASADVAGGSPAPHPQLPRNSPPPRAFPASSPGSSTLPPHDTASLSPKAPAHRVPTATDTETHSIPETPADTRFDMQEGVIDLRTGTDYSKFPDVYEYLQLVGKNLGNHGSALELAERGRCHLKLCMAKGEGLFVPPEQYITTPDPAPGPIRYNEAVALEQPPFTANTWAKLLETHLYDIGEVARVRLEDDYPDLCDWLRRSQCIRVVKGLGWAIGITPLNRASIDTRVLLTNIRAPIPRFQGDPPVPHSPEYTELLTDLYHTQLHPVGWALQEPAYNQAGILAKISCFLAERRGMSVVKVPLSSGRYDAPWSNWNEEAELRDVATRDPELFDIYEEERRREKANPVLDYTGMDVWELCARAKAGWCIHDEPRGCCWECVDTFESEKPPRSGREERLDS